MDTPVPVKYIIGIDPGTNLLGFGVIKVEDRKASFVDMGVLDLRKITDSYQKLKQIFDTVTQVIISYHGTEMALEAPFYGKNAQSLIKLGRAQGAAMMAALHRDLPVTEYSPREVKMSVAGNGAASKEQVAMMLQKTLSFEMKVEHLDATDALAIAMCHFYATTSPLFGSHGSSSRHGSSSGKRSGSWDDFIKNNPDRIK